MTEAEERRRKRTTVAPVYSWIALSLRGTVQTDGYLQNKGDQVFLACDKNFMSKIMLNMKSRTM